MGSRGTYDQGRTETAHPPHCVDPDAVRDQLERILVNPLFANSKRYSNLLKFVTDRTLDGRYQDLKERVIGVEVFGRSPDYDTSLDPTVRVAAAEVRKRLTLYYKEVGHEYELRIDVPTGSYGAEFHFPQHSPPIVSVERTKPSFPYLRHAILACLIAILGVGTWAALRAFSAKPVIDVFWAPVLSSPGAVAFYLPAPINGYSGATEAPPPIETDSKAPVHEFIQQRARLAMADVTAASYLSSFFQRKGRESTVRAAGSVNLSELRMAPTVLLGSYSNDWAMKLGENLRFRFRRESPVGLRWIEDSTHPESRDWAMNFSAPYGEVSEDYALISRVLDPMAGKWLVTIGGLTGSGTATASEFVSDPNAMTSLGPRLPRGWAKRNVQIVLAVKLVQGSPGASEVIATHVW